jgi:hypothetical protein
VQTGRLVSLHTETVTETNRWLSEEQIFTKHCVVNATTNEMRWIRLSKK